MLFRGFIHRIHSEIIFHVNPNLYTAWLGTVDRQYPAYRLDLRTHHPTLSLAAPPPPTPRPHSSLGKVKEWWSDNLTGLCGRRTIKPYPRASNFLIWALESSVTVLRSSRAVELGIGFWISAHGDGSSLQYFHTLSSPSFIIFEEYHHLFQPQKWKGGCFAFIKLPWFC